MEALERGVVNRQLDPRFGSKRGFLKFLGYQVCLNLGLFRRFETPIPDPTKRLVFVCMGNLCRSPLAEYYAKKLGLNSASCGILCTNGSMADPRTVSYAKKNLGLDLSSHRTINIKEFEFRKDDIVFCMEPGHVPILEKIGVHQDQIRLIGLWHPNKVAYIHDPFNSSERYFDRCSSIVLESIKGLNGEKK